MWCVSTGSTGVIARTYLHRWRLCKVWVAWLRVIVMVRTLFIDFFYLFIVRNFSFWYFVFTLIFVFIIYCSFFFFNFIIRFQLSLFIFVFIIRFFYYYFFYYFHVGVIRRWHGPGSVSLLPDPHTGPVHVLKSYQVRTISIFCVEHCILYYHLNNLHYAIIIANYFNCFNFYISSQKRSLFLQFLFSHNFFI